MAIRSKGPLSAARVACLTLIGVCLASTAWAADLIMVRRQGCPWCAAWDREVGPIYGKSEVGRAAPLRMVDLDKGDLPAGIVRPVRYTPTFLLMENGHEVGRIEGYPGEGFFWARLEKLVAAQPAFALTAPFPQAPAAR